jgi:hypothetical protein
VNGNFAAQGPLGGTLQRNGYQQTIALAANTDYILSGYAWNFSPINFDLVLVELRDSVDPSIVRNFSLAPLDNSTGPLIDGSRGVFGYRSFTSSIFTSGSVILEASFEYDAFASPTFPDGRPNVSGQIDNIAITPTSQFAPPQAVPEPASALALGGLAALAASARRRRA